MEKRAMGKLDWMNNMGPTQPERKEEVAAGEDHAPINKPAPINIPQNQVVRRDHGGATVTKGLKPDEKRATYVVKKNHDKLLNYLCIYRSTDERKVYKQDILREALEEYFASHNEEASAAQDWYLLSR